MVHWQQVQSQLTAYSLEQVNLQQQFQRRQHQQLQQLTARRQQLLRLVQLNEQQAQISFGTWQTIIISICMMISMVWDYIMYQLDSFNVLTSYQIFIEILGTFTYYVFFRIYYMRNIWSLLFRLSVLCYMRFQGFKEQSRKSQITQKILQILTFKAPFITTQSLMQKFVWSKKDIYLKKNRTTLRKYFVLFLLLDLITYYLIIKLIEYFYGTDKYNYDAYYPQMCFNDPL